MKPSIKRLNPQLVDAVRAGSAVSTSSYAGAVCELIANAVDAIDASRGSGGCSIEVCLDAPRGYIRVEDSGIGIGPEDMEKVGQRYCTSKISGVQDVRNGTRTLGFRGEALASLSTMCLQLRIASRVQGSFETMVKTFQGQSSTLRPSGPGEMQARSGTTVTCSGFMHGQPVRLKKTLDRHQEMLEQAVWAAFRLVLPFLHVALLVKEPRGKVLLQLEQGRSLESCLPLLFPSISSVVSSCVQPPLLASGSWQLVGFVSREPMVTRDRQLLYVNRRLVSSALVTDFMTAWFAALGEAPAAQPRQHDRGGVSRDPDKARLHPSFLLLLTCPGQEVEFNPETDRTLATFRGLDTLKTLLQALCDQCSQSFKSKPTSGAASVTAPAPTAGSAGAVPGLGLGLGPVAACRRGSLESSEQALPAAKGQPQQQPAPAKTAKGKPGSSGHPVPAGTIIGKFLESVSSRRGLRGREETGSKNPPMAAQAMREASRVGHERNASNAAPGTSALQAQRQFKDAALRQTAPHLSAQRPAVIPGAAEPIQDYEDSYADYDMQRLGREAEGLPSRFQDILETDQVLLRSPQPQYHHSDALEGFRLLPSPAGSPLASPELPQRQAATRSQGHEGEFLAALLDDLDAVRNDQQARRRSKQFLNDISQAGAAPGLRLQDVESSDNQPLSPSPFYSTALTRAQDSPCSSGLHLLASPASPQLTGGSGASPLAAQTMLQFGPDLQPIQVQATQAYAQPSPAAFSPPVTNAGPAAAGGKAQGKGCLISPMQLMDTSPTLGLSQQTFSLDSNPLHRPPKRAANHRTPAPAGFAKSRRQPAAADPGPSLPLDMLHSLRQGIPSALDSPCSSFSQPLLRASPVAGDDEALAACSSQPAVPSSMSSPLAPTSSCGSPEASPRDGATEQVGRCSSPAAAHAPPAAAATVCRRLQYDLQQEPAFSPGQKASHHHDVPQASLCRSTGGQGKGGASDEHLPCQSAGIQPRQVPQPGRKGQNSVRGTEAMQPLSMPGSAQAVMGSCSLVRPAGKPCSRAMEQDAARTSSPSSPAAAPQRSTAESRAVRKAAAPAACSAAALLDDVQRPEHCSWGNHLGHAASVGPAVGQHCQQAPGAAASVQQQPGDAPQQEQPGLKVKKQVHFSSPLAVSAGLPCSRWSPRIRVASACAAKQQQQQHPVAAAATQRPGAGGSGLTASPDGRRHILAQGPAPRSPGDVLVADQGSLEADSPASSSGNSDSGDTDCTNSASLYATAMESFTVKELGCSAEHPGCSTGQQEAGSALASEEDPAAAAAAAAEAGMCPWLDAAQAAKPGACPPPAGLDVCEKQEQSTCSEGTEGGTAASCLPHSAPADMDLWPRPDPRVGEARAVSSAAGASSPLGSAPALAGVGEASKLRRRELQSRLRQLLPSAGPVAACNPLLRPSHGTELLRQVPPRIPSAAAAGQEQQEPDGELGPVGPVPQSQLQRLLSGGWQNPMKAQRAHLQATQVATLEELGQRLGPGRAGLHQARLVPAEITKYMLDAAVMLDQVDTKFIAMTCGDTLVIADQHASDERVRLERFEAAVLAARPAPPAAGGMSLEGPVAELNWADPAALSSVTLERPQAMQLTRLEVASWHAHKATAQAWGWVLLDQADPDEGAAAPVSGAAAGAEAAYGAGFGTHATLLVARVPCVLGVALNATDLRMFLLQLSESSGSDDVPEAVQRLLKSKACRSAVMFGDPLTSSSCRDLVRCLQSTKLWSSCAHGRPTMVPIVNLSVLKQAVGYEM